MGKQSSTNISPSREYLNYLGNQLLDIEAKHAALEELYTPLEKDHGELDILMTSVKHQIKREEGLNTIDDIKPAASSDIKKYKAHISLEEVESDEDTSKKLS